MSETVNRREFGKASVAALAAGAAAQAAPGKRDEGRAPRRVLGRTGIQVGILGLGGAGFLNDSDDKESAVQLINEAIDAGINYFDTARVYGNGQSEENLGLVMGTARRKEVFLATKTRERTYDGALKDAEASLKALRTDYVDLIQVHGFGHREPDDVAALGRPNGVLRALQRLRDEKSVRFIGITGHPNWPKLKEAIAVYDFDTLLCFVNPRAECRYVDGELLPLARRKNMGVIAMKVFGGGDPARLVGDGQGKAPAAPLLRYALSAPIAVAVPAVANRAELRQNLEVARTFTPMLDWERRSLIARINASSETSRDRT
jgi:aryl-alcohol dehydrogenase-like predicted oxidoreductase